MLPGVLRAQWKLLNTFPAAVSAIYIQPGPGTFGFVGLTNGEVYRTENAGVTWQLVNTGSQAVEFAFENDSVGYCAGKLGCTRTTNRGTTWVSAVLGGYGESVAYIAKSNSIWFTSTNSSYYSSDHGISWSKQGIGLKGVDMVTPLAGVASGHSDGGSWGPGTWFTRNGLFWSQSTGYSGWQASTARCTGECYLIQDQNFGLLKSNDTGRTWNFVGNAPPNPTGCLRSDAKRLYAQTTAGFFASTDWGLSWQEIGGTTHVKNSAQTRFCVVNGNIYAGDMTGALYVYTEFAISPVDVKPDTIHKFKVWNTCADTMFSLPLLNAECLSTEILSIECFNSGVISFPQSQFPLLLNQTKSAVRVDFWNPRMRGSYIADAEVHYVQHTGEGDRPGVAIVKIQIDVIGEQVEFPSRAVVLSSQCIKHDSSFVVRNPACDRIIVESATLSGLNIVGVTPGQFPITIDSGSQKAISIDINATSRIVDRWLDLALHIKTNSDAIDTTMRILFNVQSDVRAAIDGLLNFQKASPGDRVSHNLHITNPGCQPLDINSAKLQNGNNFRLDTLSSIPVRLQPGDTARFALSFMPTTVGELSDAIMLELNIGGVAVDTLLSVHGNSIEKPLSVTSPDASLLDFTLSPNPARDGVLLNLSRESLSGVKIDVFNTLGVAVYHRDRSSGERQLIPTSAFSAGTYYVRVESGGKSLTKRLEIVH
jgi:hypothetical protein